MLSSIIRRFRPIMGVGACPSFSSHTRNDLNIMNLDEGEKSIISLKRNARPTPITRTSGCLPSTDLVLLTTYKSFIAPNKNEGTNPKKFNLLKMSQEKTK